ncbi:hypothetical protein LEN26_008664 [Aphanomyces euteiches]|nr:hypothetical protein LEN26_008664 [Aphanomyces euteiches]
MKSYYFDPASVVRRGFSYVNGNDFHSKYVHGLLLFHLILETGLHSASSRIPTSTTGLSELEQADLLLQSLCDEKDVPLGISAEGWNSSQIATILVSLYKSKIADEAVKNQYDILCKWCLELVSNTPSDDNSLTKWHHRLRKVASKIRVTDADYVKNEVTRAPFPRQSQTSPWDVLCINAAALGLPETLDSYFDWKVVETTLNQLIHLTSLPPSIEGRERYLEAIKFQLPKESVFQHAARKAWHSSSNSLEKILWHEMLALEKYITKVWACLRSPSENNLDSYASPLRLRDWITWLQASVSMYQEWLWTLRCPLIRLQAFQNPQALLMTMLNMYAVAHEIPVCDLCLAASRPTLTTNVPKLQIAHLFFRNAKWDGHHLCSLDDNEHLMQRSPPIEIFAWQLKDVEDALFACPIYSYYYTNLPNAGLVSPTTKLLGTIYFPTRSNIDLYHAKGVVCVLNEAFHS